MTSTLNNEASIDGPRFEELQFEDCVLGLKSTGKKMKMINFLIPVNFQGFCFK